METVPDFIRLVSAIIGRAPGHEAHFSSSDTRGVGDDGHGMDCVCQRHHAECTSELTAS